MATTVWPPIAPDQLARQEDAAQARELQWLLSSLRDTLKVLKAGLEECAALLAPSENGSTLVVSTVRSESLKGFVTRVGARIVKGVRLWLFRDLVTTTTTHPDSPSNPALSSVQDIKLRLPSLPPPRGAASYPLSISQAPEAPTLVVHQLTAARTHINSCLDVIDVTTWTGDARNANFISGQLGLLYDNIEEARQALRGAPEVRPQWWNCPVDEKIFDPPLPADLSFHIYLQDAAIILELRTLEPFDATSSDSTSIFGIRRAIAGALGVSSSPVHDEADKVFDYGPLPVRPSSNASNDNEGERDARPPKMVTRQAKVREKVRVESQDPNLIAATAKLNALEHHLALSRKALDIVMGREPEDEAA
ncbi:RAVE subunit 2/Rogdi [Phyllosticta citribraziliensis]|uniref:RAVE subunit 2/Rogdi n=1 Tax=Phyllosticta citribraziliensis TaxID=989973 RepID=A0ABR1LPT2_9PEZI